MELVERLKAYKCHGKECLWHVEDLYDAETLATRLRLAPRTEGYTTPHLAVFVKLTSLLHHTLWILYVSHNMYFSTLKRPLFCKGYLKAHRSYRLILYGFFKNSCTILQHTGGGVSRKALVASYCDPLPPSPETPKINRYTFL